MKTSSLRRVLSVALMIMFLGGQAIMAQENESKEFHRISVGAGWIQKQNHPIGIGSSTNVDVMDGFYAKLGVDYSINDLPIGMGVSAGLNYAFLSEKEKNLGIKKKYKMNVWSIPAEVHVFYLLKVPESKICVMPFVGVGVERMLSWKAEYEKEDIITEDITTQEFDFLEKGKDHYEMKQNQLFWHLGTDILLNKRISMKISYQRYFDYIDKEEEAKSYQLSLGLTYSFGL